MVVRPLKWPSVAEPGAENGVEGMVVSSDGV
jgi:hypothetical protein